MHHEVLAWVERHGATADPVTVLEIGARDVNGTVRHLFPHATRYIGVDLTDGPSVDIVADAADLDLGETFDIVVSTEVLEHAERWRDIVRRAAAHLNPGGRLSLTAAGPGRGAHGADGSPAPHPGEWYENVAPADLRTVLEACGLVDIVVDVHGADVRAYAAKGR